MQSQQSYSGMSPASAGDQYADHLGRLDGVADGLDQLADERTKACMPAMRRSTDQLWESITNSDEASQELFCRCLSELLQAGNAANQKLVAIGMLTGVADSMLATYTRCQIRIDLEKDYRRGSLEDAA